MTRKEERMLEIKVAGSLSSILSAASVLGCLLVLPYICYEVLAMYREIEVEMSDFRDLSNSLWEDIMELGKGGNERVKRQERHKFYLVRGDFFRDNHQGAIPINVAYGGSPPLPDTGIRGGTETEGPWVGPDIVTPGPTQQGRKCTVPGPKGARGADGMDGMAGPKGVDGPDGKDAPDFDVVEACDLCVTCPQGPPGRRGPKGRPGSAGNKGNDGRDGNDGRPGSPGVPGDRGWEGRMGQMGNPGPDGPPGRDAINFQGQPGERGPNGQVGPPGRAGQPGREGQRGNPGFPGILGKPGPDGNPGPNGEYGPKGFPGGPGDDAKYCPCPGRSFAFSVLTK